VPKDVVKAQQYDERACSEGQIDGCYRAAERSAAGDGVAQDRVGAGKLFRLACEQDHAVSCRRLANLYDEQGEPERAAPLFERACKLQDMVGCGDWGVALLTGEGVAEDKVQGFRVTRKACEGGNSHACRNLGLAYQNGDGVTADDASAAQAFQQACQGGSEDGCAWLAACYREGRGVTANEQEAVRWTRKACSLGHEDSCDWLDSKGYGR
jgi:TPR repeat protein